MLDLGPRQRALVADKLSDFANSAAGGLVFGQLIADRPFSPVIAFVGLSIWSVLLAVSVALEGRDK